jgi:hypothetical protein
LDTIIFEPKSQLEQIEERAFAHSSLSRIVLPPGVLSIDGSAFEQTPLTVDSVLIGPGLSNFVISDGMLTDLAQRRFVRWFGTAPSVCIPNWITCISRGCFSGCQLLHEIMIESESCLQTLEKEAFKSTALKHVWIPRSIEFIGDECFSMSHSLSRVDFEPGSALRRIGSHAFLGTAVTTTVIVLADGYKLIVDHPQSEVIITRLTKP